MLASVVVLLSIQLLPGTLADMHEMAVAAGLDAEIEAEKLASSQQLCVPAKERHRVRVQFLSPFNSYSELYIRNIHDPRNIRRACQSHVLRSFP